MPTQADSIQSSVSTDPSELKIDKEWRKEVINDDSVVFDEETYSLRIHKRDSGEEYIKEVTSVSFRDSVNAAYNPTFSVPYEEDISNSPEDFLGSSVEWFIDGILGFSGEAIVVDASEREEDDIDIKCRSPGHELSDESVDFQPDNEVYQDVLLKIIDRFNDFDSENSEEIDSAQPTGVTISGNTVFGDGGYIEYPSVGSSAYDVDRINVKCYSPNGEVELIFSTSEYSFSYSFSNLDKNSYGEWETVDVPVFPDESYDIRFNIDDGGYIIDWISITERKLTRDAIAPDISSVGDSEELYSRSFSELESNADPDYTGVIFDEDVSNDDGTTTGVVWDNGVYRTRQKAVWYTYDSDSLNSASDSDATNGYAYLGDSGNLGDDVKYSPDDTIYDWELHARIKTRSQENPDPDAVWSVEVDGVTHTVSAIAPNTEYEWRTVAEGNYFSDWDDDVSGSSSIEITFENDSSSEVDISVCSFVLTHGEQSPFVFLNYTFDNELSSGGQLDRPYEYSSGTVTFEPGVSDDNISFAETETSLINTNSPIDSWGPAHRTDDTTPFFGPRDSDIVEDSFVNTGVSHRVQVHLAASGQQRENDSPRRGYEPMQLSSYSVSVSTNDLEIIFDQTLTGNRLSVISELVDSSTFVFRWNGNECKVFQRGQEEANVDLRAENIVSSVGIEDTYTSVEVFGVGGLSSGIYEAENPPDFVDRHKEIRDTNIETELDARREAIAFLRNNSSIEYEGEISTLPTFAPVGAMISGDNFSHGQDMMIEEVRYRKNNTTISLGFERRLARKLTGIDRTNTALVREQTTN